MTNCILDINVYDPFLFQWLSLFQIIISPLERQDKNFSNGDWFLVMGVETKLFTLYNLHTEEVRRKEGRIYVDEANYADRQRKAQS